MAYGIANPDGQVPRARAADIVRQARSAGIDTIDTAAAYDDSEQCLGDAGMGGWKVVSKLTGLPAGVESVTAWVAGSARDTLARLGIPQLYALLLHRPLDLLETDGAALYRAMLDLRDAGIVGRIGVSIYDPSMLDALWTSYRFDLVQAPLSVLDRRLADSGWMDRLADAGVEVHARSVFLQGLLLMEPGRRPPEFSRWNTVLGEWDRWRSEAGVSAVEACLSVPLSFPAIARVVVGVERVEQLREILDAAHEKPLSVPESLCTRDADLIDPFRWVRPA